MPLSLGIGCAGVKGVQTNLYLSTDLTRLQWAQTDTIDPISFAPASPAGVVEAGCRHLDALPSERVSPTALIPDLPMITTATLQNMPRLGSEGPEMAQLSRPRPVFANGRYGATVSAQ
jgi:hypothetical protein